MKLQKFIQIVCPITLRVVRLFAIRAIESPINYLKIGVFPLLSLLTKLMVADYKDNAMNIFIWYMLKKALPYVIMLKKLYHMVYALCNVLADYKVISCSFTLLFSFSSFKFFSFSFLLLFICHVNLKMHVN